MDSTPCTGAGPTDCPPAVAMPTAPAIGASIPTMPDLLVRVSTGPCPPEPATTWLCSSSRSSSESR